MALLIPRSLLRGVFIQAGVLDRSKITPAALTALTLFVAESDAKHKEKMVRLILQLLKK